MVIFFLVMLGVINIIGVVVILEFINKKFELYGKALERDYMMTRDRMLAVLESTQDIKRDIHNGYIDIPNQKEALKASKYKGRKEEFDI